MKAPANKDQSFRILAERMPYGVVLLGEEALIRYSNPIARKLLISDESELEGKSFNAIFSERFDSEWNNIDDSSRHEVTCQETHQTISVQKVDLGDVDLDGEFLIILEDITDEKASQNELVNMAHQVVCLRNVSKLLSNTENPLDSTLNSFVHLILEGWRHPDFARARVSFGSHSIQTADFEESQYKITSTFSTGNETEGILEVFYSDDVPAESDGIFSEGEQILIETLSTELAQFIQRKQTELIRDQQHQELEIYASLLRHDLKNDLGIILGNVEILRMTAIDDDPELEDIVTSTEAVCLRMNKLLTSFSRSKEVGKQNIVTMIENAAQQAERAHRGLKIDVNAKDKARIVNIGESRLLPLVFENLFRNSAVHASEDAHVEVDIALRNQEVEIIVSDDGPGIADQIRDRLFQKGASTRGGGLGLYLSRRVVTTLGGTIELVEPKPGRGATFAIVIPVSI